MSREIEMSDSEFWGAVKLDSQRRRKENLDGFDLQDWYKVSDYSFRKVLGNIKFTYYASTKCLVVNNKSYKGIHKEKLDNFCYKLNKKFTGELR